MKRALLVRVAAVLALVAAGGLIVFALDVLRWERQLAEQDVNFLAVPGQARYSEPAGLLPFGIAMRVLAGHDDLAFRRQLQAFTRVRSGGITDATRYEQLRGELQLELARLSRVDPDRRRRSRAANMVGVLALDPQLAPTFREDFVKLVQGAIDAFRYAAELDPANADAKRNLELALRIPGTSTLPPNAPSGSRDVGRTAGLGTIGSGY
ncbi:MAG TPA: hypothetical protein VFR32_05210 [Gaiellaceae bacterium]|nr:hypothetical protein [Gaiellaceae bacterium]